MNLTAAIGVALTALRVNALRSFLAILGVIFGVAAVITTVSLAQGASQAIEEQISGLGANSLTIVPGSQRGPRRGGGGSGLPLSDADVAAILEQVEYVVAASGVVQGGTTAVLDGANWPTTIYGTNASYFEVRDWIIEEGRGFNDAETQRSARVALIGQTIADELFEGTDPIGATIRLNNQPFEVIGLIAERGQSSFGGDHDDIVVAPISTVRERVIGYRRPGVRDPVRQIVVKVGRASDIDYAIEDITALLEDRREGEAFRVLNFSDMIRAFRATESVLGLLLAAAGLITLIVGGVGIMNVMLVSVTERTREIGLRLAVGARRSDIRNQFLIESVVLCFLGGAIGMALGILMSLGLEQLGPMLGVNSLNVAVDAMVALVAIIASASIGIIFGFYPALRASRLDPIEALRHE
jgi:putative ABC transport system permease protein